MSDCAGNETTADPVGDDGTLGGCVKSTTGCFSEGAQLKAPPVQGAKLSEESGKHQNLQAFNFVE